MKIKTATAEGEVLNWLVATCEGYGPDQYMKNIDIRSDVKGKCSCLLVPINREYIRWTPSTDWAQAGPIIEREKIDLDLSTYYGDSTSENCVASITRKARMLHQEFGKTPLIAAMRCYVASKLGDEVEVPDEL